jgi:hypothetical protein
MSFATSPKHRTTVIDWRLQLRMLGCIVGRDMDEHDHYDMLRGAGASALEALDALLAEAPTWEKAAVLGNCLPTGLGLASLQTLLQCHGIHPLSVAVNFQNRRRAAIFLDRLGLRDRFWGWIGPGGRFQLRHSSVQSLPPGLVLRGWPLIADCPELVDLGTGLTNLVGNLTVERCPKLQRLPDGLETIGMPGTERMPDGSDLRLNTFGDLWLVDCPGLSGFGFRTRIRGRIVVEGCPGLEGIDLEGYQADPFDLDT